MATDLSKLRKEYQLKQLDTQEVATSPFDQLRYWLDEAISQHITEPSAMTLATVNAQGKPSARIVLLKAMTSEGLVFYTNYQSRKGKELAQNPYASLLFFWPDLERQIRIEGRVVYTDGNDSEAYFHSRPRGSQIGALASPQSQKVDSRAWMEDKIKALEEKYKDREIPRPEHWGGYILKPDYFEFWQGRASRVHDRVAYELSDAGEWDIYRLAP